MIYIYSKKVIENFLIPKNCYYMDDFSADSRIGDSSCGDSIWMFIKVEKDILTEVSYLVQGCPASIATSSMTSILAKGKSISEALNISEEDVINALDGLPGEKAHCSNLGVGALREAINKFLEEKSNK